MIIACNLAAAAWHVRSQFGDRTRFTVRNSTQYRRRAERGFGAFVFILNYLFKCKDPVVSVNYFHNLIPLRFGVGRDRREHIYTVV